jgi:hypothetical protein
MPDLNSLRQIDRAAHDGSHTTAGGDQFRQRSGSVNATREQIHKQLQEITLLVIEGCVTPAQAYVAGDILRTILDDLR